MKKLNNKGVTLVEMILGILILSIAAIAFFNGMSTATSLINHATLYKNASSTLSSSIDMGEIEASKDESVKPEMTFKSTDDGTPVTITINGTTTKTIKGQYMICSDTGDTNLKYKEFLPTTYSFDVPATAIVPDD